MPVESRAELNSRVHVSTWSRAGPAACLALGRRSRDKLVGQSTAGYRHRARLRRPLREKFSASRDMRFTDPETGVTSGLPEVAICVQDFDVQCVLQFTLVNAAGCALHRHTSRVIHRIEWFLGCCTTYNNVADRFVASNRSSLFRWPFTLYRCTDLTEWAIAKGDSLNLADAELHPACGRRVRYPARGAFA